MEKEREEGESVSFCVDYIGVCCLCVCVRYKAAACIKARAAGLLLAFFRPPDACHCFKKKRAGDEEGRRTKTRGGRGGGGGPPLFKSCHVALIHPASLERGKGPEGLSQDRAQAQTHNHTQLDAYA